MLALRVSYLNSDFEMDRNTLLNRIYQTLELRSVLKFEMVTGDHQTRFLHPLPRLYLAPTTYFCAMGDVGVAYESSW